MGQFSPSPLTCALTLLLLQNELQYAVPGGLIGVGLTVDPTLTRADKLVGQVLGQVRGRDVRGNDAAPLPQGGKAFWYCGIWWRQALA